MSIIEIILGVGIIFFALVIVVLVTIQESKGGGLAGSIGGGDAMLMEGRSRSNNLAAAKYTKYAAIGMFVFIFATALAGVFL